MPDDRTLGFIGLGVMGEAMCRNLARAGEWTVVAFDPRPEPLVRLAGDGVVACDSVAEVAGRAMTILLSLPAGPEVEAVCAGPGGLLECARPGSVVVDHGTTPVALTRDLAARLAVRRIAFVDAPVTRTRQAALDGTLSIMVGAEPALFERLRPLLSRMGSDVSRCGPTGCGQVVKLMNNMVLLQTVVALSEALSVARRAGVPGEVLFEVLEKGSADSFGLRNHGRKALLPAEFPLNAFSTRYALKDLSYALDLAGEAGIDTPGARLADRLLRRADEAGWGEHYFPALLHVVDPDLPGGPEDGGSAG